MNTISSIKNFLLFLTLIIYQSVCMASFTREGWEVLGSFDQDQKNFGGTIKKYFYVKPYNHITVNKISCQGHFDVDREDLKDLQIQFVKPIKDLTIINAEDFQARISNISKSVYRDKNILDSNWITTNKEHHKLLEVLYDFNMVPDFIVDYILKQMDLKEFRNVS